MGPIPWTDIHYYGKAHGYSDGDEMLWFIGLIQSMDSAYIAFISKRNQKHKLQADAKAKSIAERKSKKG